MSEGTPSSASAATTANTPSSDELPPATALRDLPLTRSLLSAALGWRERDWPEGFHRATADLFAEHLRDVALQLAKREPAAAATPPPTWLEAALATAEAVKQVAEKLAIGDGGFSLPYVWQAAERIVMEERKRAEVRSDLVRTGMTATTAALRGVVQGSFEWALYQLRLGNRVRLRSWEDSESYLVLRDGELFQNSKDGKPPTIPPDELVRLNWELF